MVGYGSVRFHRGKYGGRFLSDRCFLSVKQNNGKNRWLLIPLLLFSLSADLSFMRSVLLLVH